MSTRRGVVYTIDADTRKAIDGVLKVSSQLKQTERAAASMERRGSNSFRGMERAGSRAFGSLNRGLAALGLAGGAAGFGALISKGFREIEASARGLGQFEKELTPLLSLGDNVNFSEKIKREVMDTAAVFGRSNAEVADFFFRLQSGASGFDPALQRAVAKESLELARVTGGDLPSAVQVMIKAAQNYNDELRDMNDLQNRLFFTAEKGDILFPDLARHAPRVLAQARAFGFELNEVLGGVVVATQAAGSPETAFTGLRNFYGKLGEAAEELDLSGSLTEQLAQIDRAIQADPNRVKDLFGEEAFATVAAMAARFGEVETAIRDLDAVAADVDLDIVSERFTRRMDDAQFRLTSLLEGLKQIGEQKSIELTPGELARQTEFEASKAGAVAGLPAGLKWTAGFVAAADVARNRIGEAVSGDRYETFLQQRAFEERRRQLLSQGDLAGAERLQANRQRVLQGDEDEGTPVSRRSDEFFRGIVPALKSFAEREGAGLNAHLAGVEMRRRVAAQRAEARPVSPLLGVGGDREERAPLVPQVIEAGGETYTVYRRADRAFGAGRPEPAPVEASRAAGLPFSGVEDLRPGVPVAERFGAVSRAVGPAGPGADEFIAALGERIGSVSPDLRGAAPEERAGAFRGMVDEAGGVFAATRAALDESAPFKRFALEGLPAGPLSEQDRHVFESRGDVFVLQQLEALVEELRLGRTEARGREGGGEDLSRGEGSRALSEALSENTRALEANTRVRGGGASDRFVTGRGRGRGAAAEVAAAGV